MKIYIVSGICGQHQWIYKAFSKFQEAVDELGFLNEVLELLDKEYFTNDPKKDSDDKYNHMKKIDHMFTNEPGVDTGYFITCTKLVIDKDSNMK